MCIQRVIAEKDDQQAGVLRSFITLFWLTDLLHQISHGETSINKLSSATQQNCLKIYGIV